MGGVKVDIMSSETDQKAKRQPDESKLPGIEIHGGQAGKDHIVAGGADCRKNDVGQHTQAHFAANLAAQTRDGMNRTRREAFGMTDEAPIVNRAV